MKKVTNNITGIILFIVISCCFISCSKYHRYRNKWLGPGMKHDVGTSNKIGTFFYTPPDSTIKK